MPRDRVPISPAFHYAVGGIKSDLQGAVVGAKNLYVAGEAACTGVHGANRLASNSLLEGLVFGARVAQTIQNTQTTPCVSTFELSTVDLELESDKEKKDILRRLMWDKVSIVRTPEGLKEALEAIEQMLNEKVGRLLQLRLLSAKEIVSSALKRSESIGVHYITGAVC
jgi:L-aspartate oxidase